MRVEIERVGWSLVTTFRTAMHQVSEVATVQVRVCEGGFLGRGEALGVFYHGETIDSIVQQLESLSPRDLQYLTRVRLQQLLPPGGARNALDCALWDLEAKRAGRRAWDLAGLTSVSPLTTAYTLGVDTPQAMAERAAAAGKYSLLKLKLDGKEDVERVHAVRCARQDAELIVDANQAWTERELRAFTPRLAELGVKLIEQPLPAGQDEMLTSFNSPVPLCADEACQSSASLSTVIGKYQYVNIKLDKTGGLTEALQLAKSAQAHQLDLMVGCMAGSSLSMAPAFVVGQLCSVVDLDGPLLASGDLPHAIEYVGSRMSAPEPDLWG